MEPAPRIKPPWLRVRMPCGGRGAEVTAALAARRLHTVCDGAACPNRSECFHRGVATFMILGDVCTRRCAFCAVPGGTPPPPDAGEPEKVAAAAAALGLRHVVVTSVTRDDLPDGGAAMFAAVIREVRRANTGVGVEVLTPDFGGRGGDVDTVLTALPEVFNHNLETVERLQPLVRPQAGYGRSLRVLQQATERGGMVVKSGLLCGLGETDAELELALRHLREVGCEAVTLGQYLPPSPRHHPLARYIPPEEFLDYERRARAMGFRAVAAGPLVRSSYKARELFEACRRS